MQNNEVVSWLRQHATYIEQQLLAHKGNLNYTLNSSALKLSDLQLCGAIETMEEPPGYKWTQKRVTNKNTGLVRRHRFYEPEMFKRENRVIVDFLFGQFFTDDDSLVSGVSIATKIAPELFVVLSEQVCVLYASHLTIEEKLGLSY